MVKFKKNVPLSRFSNYKIGGPTRYFFEPKTVEAVKGAVEKAKKDRLPFFVLGGGTNLLISDKGFNGLTLKLNFKSHEIKGTEIHAGAGVLMKDLLRFAAHNNLSGLEWAGGLPGTLGGAIRGNAGCFGGEIKDVVNTVTSFNTKTMRIAERTNRASKFGYRSSIFKQKKNEEIVLGAILKLKKGNEKDIKKAIEEKIDYRNTRHPLEYPNIGSIFKNVEVAHVPKKYREFVKNVIKADPFPVVPAAFLISEAGLKGATSGGAMVSPKHPNFIVNVSHAKAAHVKKLIALVQNTVAKKFGVRLEKEIIEI